MARTAASFIASLIVVAPGVQRTPEDEGETQDVVDLVRVVRAAGADHRIRPHRDRLFRHDFRRRVGHRQDDRVARHRLDHLRLEHAAGRQAEEDVGAGDHLAQRARAGVACIARLVRIHAFSAAEVDHALGVTDQDVLALQAQAHRQVQAGQRGSTRTRSHELHLGDVLAHVLQRIEDGRRRDDGRAVLVVVEDGNLHALAQPGLDVEALGRLDVLEIDAAEGGLHAGDGLDQRVRVVLGELDVEHVDAGELLEETPLAFHHRLAGQRADVAQAQDRRAVGDDGHQVAACGQVARLERVFGDRHAGIGDPGRISQRQVACGGHRLGRRDRDLARRGVTVVVQRGFPQRVAHGLVSSCRCQCRLAPRAGLASC